MSPVTSKERIARKRIRIVSLAKLVNGTFTESHAAAEEVWVAPDWLHKLYCQPLVGVQTSSATVPVYCPNICFQKVTDGFARPLMSIKGEIISASSW